MRLRLRLLITLLRAWLFRARLDILEESVLAMRVWPNDVDLVRVTNDRYHAFMDLGRLELVARFGVTRKLAQAGWIPRIRAVTIRHRRSLKLFQRFELRTRLHSWDEKWFWFKQEFVCNGRIVSIAYSQVILHKKGHGTVSTQHVMDVAGVSYDRPERPRATQIDLVDKEPL